MKICLCSDVHGCPEALFAAVRESSPDIVLFAGDLAEKAGDHKEWAAKVSAEFVQFCRDNPAIKFLTVLGNHDYQLCDLFRSADCSNLVVLQPPYYRTCVRGIEVAGQYSDRNIESTPLDGEHILLFHKKPHREAVKRLRGSQVRLVVYGHCHRSEHADRDEKAGKVLTLDVSTNYRKGGKFGYYSIEWGEGPIEAKWHALTIPKWHN